MFRFSHQMRLNLSELLFASHSQLPIITICRNIMFSSHRKPQTQKPDLFLEGGSDIDSDSEEIPTPTVKKRNENLITVPVRLKKRLEKRLIKESTAYFQKQKIINASRLGKKTRIVVQCKRPEFNHYYGQSYAANSVIPLASKGWAHPKSAGDFFTVKPQSEELSAFSLNDENSSFENLGLDPIITEIIKKNAIHQPTHIQTFAIPEILDGNNCLIAAETGCGKTFAYLFPIFQQILDKKSKLSSRKVNQPFAVVLVPTRELADQVYNVASGYGEQLNIKVRLLQGGNVGTKIKDPSSSVVDLLISTVSVASVLTSVGALDREAVEHIVLDEADSLLDDSFNELVKDFLRKFQFFHDGDSVPIQISLVSATLPRSLDSILEDVVPVDSLVRIQTPNLHRVLAHVPQTFFRLRKSQKPEKVLEILKKDAELQVPTMVFCNKNSTCDWMNYFLHDNGFSCVALHGKKHIKYRRDLINEYQSGKTNIIACTDLGSRGLDTLRFLSTTMLARCLIVGMLILQTGHILNYDFPNFLSDYIHRCGRTGRVGSAIKGKVTNLISKPHEVLSVQEIERSVRKEESIEKVNANIKRILNAHYGMYQQILPPEKDEENV